MNKSPIILVNIRRSPFAFLVREVLWVVMRLSLVQDEFVLCDETKTGNLCCVMRPRQEICVVWWDQDRKFVLCDETKTGNLCCVMRPRQEIHAINLQHKQTKLFSRLKKCFQQFSCLIIKQIASGITRDFILVDDVPFWYMNSRK